MALTGAARERFFEQAEACRAGGSPFTARIVEALAEILGPESRFGARIQRWPGDPRDDAVPLRAASAAHALKRRGDAALAAVYPPAAVDPAALSAALADAVARQDAFLRDWLDSPPQTNETGRSGALLGGLLRVAAETGLPLILWELGGSAGLNLRLDRFRYDLSAPDGPPRAWGAADAPVAVRSEWTADDPAHLPPLDAPLRVVARAGCDRSPLDPADPAHRERLAAFVWADQAERLTRIEAALDLAASDGLKLARADAADWLAARLAEPAEPGHVRTLQHTIFWQYLPEATRTRIDAMLAEAGTRATPETPLAQLSMERDAIRGTARVGLRLWRGAPSPDGRPDGALRALGRAKYHGQAVRWIGA